MTKRSGPSIGTPLKCRDHSFFEDILKIPEEQKSFTVPSLPHKGISLRYLSSTGLLKKLIHGKILGARELETFNTFDVLDNVVSKVANAIVVVEKMGVRVGGSTRSS